MQGLRWIRNVIVTAICGAWIIFLLRSRSHLMFETVSGIGVALFVIVSMWWRRIDKHPALGPGMVCLATALIFVDTWIRKGASDFGTLFTGSMFASVMFMSLGKFRSRHP
jgi:hypothetical protein